MGFDAIFKRYFPVVVCLLIGMAAYLQASGMGQLVVSAVALDPSAVPVAGPAPHRAAAAPSSTEHATIAQPQKDEMSRDPYDDPACDTARVLLIVASDDPQWSFAAVAGSDGKSIL